MITIKFPEAVQFTLNNKVFVHLKCGLEKFLSYEGRETINSLIKNEAADEIFCEKCDKWIKIGNFKEAIRKIDPPAFEEEVYCSFCEGYISYEHGGIRCKRCGSWYCCDPTCIDIKYCKTDIGQSQGIGYCPNCEIGP